MVVSTPGEFREFAKLPTGAGGKIGVAIGVGGSGRGATVGLALVPTGASPPPLPPIHAVRPRTTVRAKTATPGSNAKLAVILLNISDTSKQNAHNKWTHNFYR
jgi:hypothetical protein